MNPSGERGTSGITSFVQQSLAVALIGIAVAIHARIDDWKRGQR